MKRAIPCFNCDGEGYVTILSAPGDYGPNALMKFISKECPICEGQRCIWIEPIYSQNEPGLSEPQSNTDPLP